MDPFIGEIRIFTGNFAPEGWLYCQGQLIQISQYQALYSLLGTIYGGDGVSTFGLPDLRGRCAVGVGTPASGTAYLLGKPGGAEQSTIPSAANLPSHTHAATSPAHSHSVTVPAHTHGFTVPAHTHPFAPLCEAGPGLDPSPAGAVPADSGAAAYTSTGADSMAAQTTGASDGSTAGTTAQSAATADTSGTATVAITVQATGNGQGFPTMSPYLPIAYIIAYTGVYPPRPQ